MTNYIIDSLFLINDLKSILPFGVDFKVLDMNLDYLDNSSKLNLSADIVGYLNKEK